MDDVPIADVHVNVCVDLSWVVFEDYLLQRNEDGTIPLDTAGDPLIRDKWVSLIKRYPRNFILGSDKVGDFSTYHGEIRKYNALLKRLSPETRQLVANGNFVRIMPAEGVTLPREYDYPERRFTKRRLPERD